ncbi:unnamed protein product [Blepharisma stoltei]|uniref:Uncharacterized protein n=1 Tax=Blepharisma stoltei TaxID=1481888 RepID=A0AAU9JEM0_9CILI|nr:unnamed protein product [Blepharisma stoltei]
MWWLAILIVVEASPSEDAVNYLNEVYKLKVTGGNESLFIWAESLSEEHIDDIYNSIIVLNNTLTLGLELHYLQFSFLDNSSAIHLIQHQNPDYTKILEPKSEEITSKFLKEISGHPHGVTLQSSKTQTIEHGDKTFAINENILTAEKSTYKFYIISNSTSKVSTYHWQVYGVTTKSSETSNTKLIITVVFTFIITSSLTVLGVCYYWKKNKSFPFLQMKDEVSAPQAKLQL